jgi:hypothetical protein
VATIRTLAFAAPDGSSWGAAWLPGDQGSFVYRVETGARVAEVELRAAAETEPWHVEGDGVSLALTPAGPIGEGGSAETGVGSVDQLCSVDGRLALEGGEREISYTGWRSTLEGEFDLGAIDSFRQASAWFEPLHGLSLLALRPRTARGQEADLVAASLLEPEPAPRVADPRLSTTYDAAGLPARVGLELWLEPESSDEDPDEDSDRQFPRRAAGEPIGMGVGWELGGFRLHAAPLRWHSRGEDGSGVYLLGQRG